jgi:phosphoglycerate dehydrogenase-like enzyme
MSQGRDTSTRVAVTSRSFSRHPVLRSELLQRYERVTFNNAGSSLRGDSLVQFLRGHEKAITALEPIDDQVLGSLPELKVIAKYGVGLDMIDMQAMRRHGKRLGWKAGINKRSVSELALSLMISCLRHVVPANREVVQGTWRQHTGGLLTGRTVGLVGCGNVGQDLVRLLGPFGCTILAHDIVDYSEFYSTSRVEAVGLDELLSRSDVVTLHVPLDDSTRGMFDRRRIALMKSSAVLINTARGGIVDEKALEDALAGGKLAGAAFDVFDVEPPQNAGLLGQSRFIATPHIGGSAAEAILAMGRAAIDGLDQNAVP